MAAGLPVIAAAPGGPAEIVADGVDGLLVASGSVDGLRAALLRLAADHALRDRLGQTAYTSAKRYTTQRTAAGLLGVYERLLGQEGANQDR
jgi:glycosyltransferase involved in cell wall biosynthesis